MQDAFGRDMFNVPNINSSRYNGHIQLSSTSKSGGGKRDRKGCTKGKIEAIMKNNAVRPKACVSIPTKKTVSTIGGNHSIYTSTPLKLEVVDQEDPYTFTESEPQSLSLYQAGSSSSKKHQSSIRITAMGCTEKVKVEPAKMVIKPQKLVEGSSKMNKLQAEIARNKVIGKRRKVEQVPVLANDWIVPSSKKEPGKICIAAKFVPSKSTWQKECKSRHELLQRIDLVQNEAELYTRDLYPLGLEASDSDDESENWRAVYERHWFSRVGLANKREESRTREARVRETRSELRRRLSQTLRGLASADLPSRDLVTAVIAAARKFPNATAAILDPTIPRTTHKINRGSRFLVTGEKCSHWGGCDGQSLPCTRHCSQHIMYNVDQRLFSHCTAKFSDNTQCSVPVFDVLHELPLCPEHASKHDNYRRFALESKPGKKVSKKSRVLGTSRSGKRSQKKRKKPSIPVSLERPNEHESAVKEVIELTTTQHEPIQQNDHSSQPQFEQSVIGEEESEEVLAIAALDPVELASQATRLLDEEHDDITNMLNQISPDAFNDLFIDKNGEYEPTREETEELERALEAVDNDVRSLERMTRALPLLQLPLESFLDDPPPSPSPPFSTFLPPATTDINPS